MATTALAAAAGPVDTLARIVGNTPMLRVRFRLDGRERVVFVKYEAQNLTGSIKDRMVLYLLGRAMAAGRLAPGDTLVEATSGNTGIALAAIGRILGHPVVIYMPDWMSVERQQLMRSFGATVVPVSREQGGFRGSIALAELHTRSHPRVFPLRQFSNTANAEAHTETTGAEIAWQLVGLDLRPDALVAGVGTGGTVMGVAEALRARWPGVLAHPLEPAESPTLRTGCKTGSHRIQGISDEFVPAILNLSKLAPILDVHDGDAILMAQALGRRLGLGVGISSGANFLGAVLAQEQLGPDAVVVTVFPDDNKKYLSSDLLSDELVRDTYLSPRVELLGYDVISRACRTCPDAGRCENWLER